MLKSETLNITWLCVTVSHLMHPSKMGKNTHPWERDALMIKLSDQYKNVRKFLCNYIICKCCYWDFTSIIALGEIPHSNNRRALI